MKNNYSIAQRNRIVEENLWYIDYVMSDKASTIRKSRLDKDDVYQQLALTLIEAVDDYDPSRGTLQQQILSRLNSEIRRMSKKRCVIVSAPELLAA